VVARGSRERRLRRRGVARLAGLGVGTAALLTLLAGCDVGAAFDGFGWPQGGATRQANRMYDLWVGSVVAALVVGFLVWGLIFWCVIRYRKRGDELPAQTRYNMPMETLYTVVPFLVIAVLFYYTAIIQTDVNKLSKDPDVTVEVVAFKWNWQFNYRSGPTDPRAGQEGQTVASTLGSTDVIPLLVLPVGRSIRFEEHSQDVIHSFWVPELLFKRDVFPGNIRNVFEVTIDKKGRYVGRCAELCGAYHSQMTFELVAVSPEDYERFLAAKRGGASTPEAMAAIGFTGDQRFAVTTHPFSTDREDSTFRGGS
jgi:cytochrome c oxidase subunit II